jgi:hypothetical protein
MGGQRSLKICMAAQKRGLKQFAGYLPALQIGMALVMVAVAVWEPYTLYERPLSLASSEYIYIRNPLLFRLTVAQFPIVAGWLLLARPKSIWQWLLCAAAVATAGYAWWVTSDPPIYLG